MFRTWRPLNLRTENRVGETLLQKYSHWPIILFAHTTVHSDLGCRIARTRCTKDRIEQHKHSQIDIALKFLQWISVFWRR